MVEYQFPVGIYQKIVVVHIRSLADASGVEADPVIFARQVELGVGVDRIAKQCIACGQNQTFPVPGASHREGVVPGFSFEEGLVRLAHSTDGHRFDVGHQRADIRQRSDSVLVRVDYAGGRDGCIAGRIYGQVHDSESHAPEEIAVPVLCHYREHFHILHIQNHLFGKVVLPDAVLIQSLPVPFDHQPYAGVAALAVLRSHNE